VILVALLSPFGIGPPAWRKALDSPAWEALLLARPCGRLSRPGRNRQGGSEGGSTGSLFGVWSAWHRPPTDQLNHCTSCHLCPRRSQRLVAGVGIASHTQRLRTPLSNRPFLAPLETEAYRCLGPTASPAGP